MSSVIEGLRQVLGQVEQEQRQINHLSAQVVALQAQKTDLEADLHAARVDAASAGERVRIQSSLLRTRDDHLREKNQQLREKDEENRRLREQVARANVERDLEREERHKAESKCLQQGEEATALIQQIEADAQYRIEEANDRATQEREARERAEEFAKVATRELSRMRRRLEVRGHEVIHLRDQVKVDRGVIRDLREELDSRPQR